MACECIADTLPGRLRHSPGERLARHRHDCGFAALVLSGSYIEAGDRGRIHVTAGDVVLHGAYESHLDHVAGSGAEVLVLPWNGDEVVPMGRVLDADAVARAAERDVDQAADLLRRQFRPVDASRVRLDWPDLLAMDIREDPNLVLEEWAADIGMRPETVSRGFRRAYGVTAAAYRVRIRLLQALARISDSRPLVEIAADAGFADQAHFTRSFRHLTGFAPRHWLARRGALPKLQSQLPRPGEAS